MGYEIMSTSDTHERPAIISKEWNINFFQIITLHDYAYYYAWYTHILMYGNVSVEQHQCCWVRTFISQYLSF